MSTEKLKLYLSEQVQLRSLVESKRIKAGLFVVYVGIFIIYLILIWGRPNKDYWSGNIDTLGGEVNLTICEQRRENEFVFLDSNAISTICPVYLGVFMILMWSLDFKFAQDFTARIANKPASILLRYPMWSLFLGLNFIFLGGTGFFFYATASENASTFFKVAQWSTILALCMISVNRLVDPPVKQSKTIRSCWGGFLLLLSIIIHVTLTAFLIINLKRDLDPEDADNSSASSEDGENSSGSVDQAVLYGLIVIGVVSAIVHWRAHSLTIIQQPLLLFVAGVLAIIAAGCFSYDNSGGSLCSQDSFFQIGSFGFMLLNIGALFVYFFLRADQWNDKPSDKVVSEKRFSLTQQVGLQRQHEEVEDDFEEVRPEPLIPVNQNRVPNRAENRRSQPQQNAQSNTVRQLDYILNLGSQRIRRATTELASSRILNPELGFTQTQIQIGEIVIGMVIVAFIVVVIYFTFNSSK